MDRVHVYMYTYTVADVNYFVHVKFVFEQYL